MKKIHVILLAAGNSRRFGNNKLLYPYKGKPMYQHVLEIVAHMDETEFQEFTIGEKIVVTQYEEIMESAQQAGFRCLRNSEPELGISHSIRMGIEAIEEFAMCEAQDAILFAVCDQPELTEEIFYGLIRSYEASSKRIACAADGERLGNPVIFESAYWEELKSLCEEQGGKTVLKRHREDVELYQVKDGKKLRDIDCLWDLKPLVVVRGGGDLATGTIHKLYEEGYRVAVLETEHPACIRRQVSFCEAIYEGKMEVEGVTAVYIEEAGEDALYKAVEKAWARGEIPVLKDPFGHVIKAFQPEVVVDAILAKKNLGTRRDMAPLTIGLGPGFTAGQDVDIVIETMRGEHLGKIYRTGSAIPNTGIPGVIAGYSKERVIHAPASGKFQPRKRIGDMVKTDEVLGIIIPEEQQEEVPVFASMTGLLRGMIKEGYLVKKGLKIMDIEPRMDEKELCFLISDKAKCIGESVYQVIKDYENSKTGR